MNENFFRRDLVLLKSFMIGSIGKDKEGKYRKEFVERALRASQETPTFEFKDAKSFLKHLQ